MKNDYGNYKDIRIALKANLAWWSVFFFLLFFIFLSAGKPSFPLSLLLAAVIAVPLDLLLMYVIFPRVNKQNAIYKEILLKINSEGYSQAVLDEMEQQLQWCKQNNAVYTVYRNNYAMYLADGYQSIHETNKAKAFLDEVDTEALFQNAETPSTQRSVALYYVLKTILLAESGDRMATEAALQEMEALFSFRKPDSLTLNHLLDTARFEFHYLNGDYAACAACMEQYREYEDMKMNVHVYLARCYWKMGRTAEANALIAELQPLLRNDWMRKTLELDCKKYLT